MGVHQLWEVLSPAGKSVSLAKLAVDAFERNTSQKRAYRIGIDASLWYKHATFSKGGKNPELRLLFFRLKTLATLPLLVLFVFDGRNRPKVKRGNRMGKSGQHELSRHLKTLLGIFGMEWREADGEAEAELAFLNRKGVIDAVMTDDADAFLFGATTIIRNTSLNLTGNRANPALNLDGKPSRDHVMVFEAEDLKSHSEIGMSQGGMILYALLTGGDYDNGVDRIGKVTAHALARCGFGDELYEAALNREQVSLHNFLPGWRHRVNTELRENRRNILRRASPGLCLPVSFPNLALLEKYVNPARSIGGLQGVWKGREFSLPQVAGFCEKFFEWGTRAVIIKRFRDLLWTASVIRVLRRAALEQDKKEADRLHHSGLPFNEIRHCRRPGPGDAVGTSISLISRYLNPEKVDDVDERISAAFVNKGPIASSSSRAPDDPKSFIAKIHSERCHVSTDKILEYRLEVDPAMFVELTHSGIKGTLPDAVPSTMVNDSIGEEEDESEGENGGARRSAKTRKAPPDPLSTFRMWCPAVLLQRTSPQIIDNYELAQVEKIQNRSRKTTATPNGTSPRNRRKNKRQSRDLETETEDSADDDMGSPQPSPQKRRRAIDRNTQSTSSTTTSNRHTNGHRLNRLPSLSQHEAHLQSTNRINPPSFSSVSAPPIPAAPTMQVMDLDRVSSFIPHHELQNGSNSFPSASQSIRTPSLSSSDYPSSRKTNSLFLFEIPDPCNPDLIDRARVDLHDYSQEPVFQWTDLSSDAGRLHNNDDSDDELESQLGLSCFARRKVDKENRKRIVKVKVGGTMDDSINRMSRTIDSGFPVSRSSSVQPALRVRNRKRSLALPSNLTTEPTDRRQDLPLFLPSPSSPTISTFPEAPSSPPRSLSPRRITDASDFIDINSSDDDDDDVYGYSSSSRFPPSSSPPSSSPFSSQEQHRDSLGEYPFASGSQANGSSATRLYDDF